MLERELNVNMEHKKDIWTSVELAWPNVEVRNKKELTDETITACVIFCPLYEHGDLDKAGIIKPPAGINTSRVSGKVQAYLTVANSIADNLRFSNQNLSVNFVVANKGVMLPTSPGENEYEALTYHNTLYKELVTSFCQKNGVGYTFSDFHDHKVDFPTFVNLKDPIPGQVKSTEDQGKSEEFLIVEYLNKFLNLPEAIENNKANRHVVKGVLHMNNITFDGAFWLIAGYLAFDYRIHSLVGENGIYFVSERIDQLFGLAKLTPSLSKLTRVQIKA